jgi:hypothetical protein
LKAEPRTTESGQRVELNKMETFNFSSFKVERDFCGNCIALAPRSPPSMTLHFNQVEAKVRT